MTRTQALNNALIEIPNYLISDSYDEHLAIQRKEMARGERKWKNEKMS